MKPLLLAAAVSLSGILAGHTAFAQTPAPASGDQADMIVVYTDADAEAVLDARIAALKTVLRLTPEQERLWAPVEASIRKIGADSAARGKERAEARPPVDFLDVLKRVAEAEATRADDLQSFVSAATPLVGSLTEEQKNRMPAFLGMTVDPERPLSPDTLWLFEEEQR